MIFSIIPIFWVIYLGFTDYNVFSPGQWVRLETFEKLFNEPKFWTALRNSVFFWALVTQAISITSLLIARHVYQTLVGFKTSRLACNLSGLLSVANDLYEAAEIDGAGFWRKQWNITIPMLRPIIFFVSVISTMGAFKEFTLMLVMTGGGPVNSTTTLVYLVFKEAFENINMGYASAIATVLFMLILIITIINMKIQDQTDQQ